MPDLQILRRLDSPEVAAVPGVVFWLLEGEGMHRHPANLQVGVVSTHNRRTYVSGVMLFHITAARYNNSV